MGKPAVFRNERGACCFFCDGFHEHEHVLPDEDDETSEHDFEGCPLPPDQCEPCHALYRHRRERSLDGIVHRAARQDPHCEREAVAEWNRRTTPPPASGERERALEEAARWFEAPAQRHNYDEALLVAKAVRALKASPPSTPLDQVGAEPPLVSGPSPLPWRCGRSVGRTIYDAHDRLIGVMDSRQDAAAIVLAINQASTPGDVDWAERAALARGRALDDAAVAIEADATAGDASWAHARAYFANVVRALKARDALATPPREAAPPTCPACGTVFKPWPAGLPKVAEYQCSVCGEKFAAPSSPPQRPGPLNAEKL